VERVDLEPGRGDGDRELPAEELAAERRCAVEVGRRPLPVGTLRRLARRGNETLAELAGGLGDELLCPQAEAAVGLGDADLVASLAPSRAERGAELIPRISLVAAAAHRRRCRRALPAPSRTATARSSGPRSSVRRGTHRGSPALSRAPPAAN